MVLDKLPLFPFNRFLCVDVMRICCTNDSFSEGKFKASCSTLIDSALNCLADGHDGQGGHLRSMLSVTKQSISFEKNERRKPAVRFHLSCKGFSQNYSVVRRKSPGKDLLRKRLKNYLGPLFESNRKDRKRVCFSPNSEHFLPVSLFEVGPDRLRAAETPADLKVALLPQDAPD